MRLPIEGSSVRGGSRPASVTTPSKVATPAVRVPAPPRVDPAQNQALGTLSWGLNPATRRPWTPAGLRAAMETSPALARDAKGLLKRARNTVDQPFRAIPRIFSEGLLASDPRKIETQKTLKRLDDVQAWAFAARFAEEPLRSKAKAAVTAALLDWAKTYKPTGNPINENRLLPLIEAADLALPGMKPGEQQRVRGFLKELLRTSEEVRLPGLCDINNWRSFNLQVRGAAAAVLGDRAATARVSKALDGLLKRTVEADGSSFDFHHRDALHYHVYNLEALVGLAASVPRAVSPESRRRIERALEFMKPYYLGRKKHLEFQHTQVQFDLDRRNAGEPSYQVHRWDPREADAVLQRARAVFPAIRAWSGAAEAGRMRERYELLASLQWPARG